MAGNAGHDAHVDADRGQDAPRACPVPEPLVARAALPELSRAHHVGGALAGSHARARIRPRPARARNALEPWPISGDPPGIAPGGALLPRLPRTAGVLQRPGEVPQAAGRSARVDLLRAGFQAPDLRSRVGQRALAGADAHSKRLRAVPRRVRRQGKPRPLLLGQLRPGGVPLLRPACPTAPGRSTELRELGDGGGLLARGEQRGVLAWRRNVSGGDSVLVRLSRAAGVFGCGGWLARGTV